MVVVAAYMALFIIESYGLIFFSRSDRNKLSNDTILGRGLGFHWLSACCNGIDHHTGHILFCSFESAMNLHISNSPF